jgi:glucose-6-phosphate dehydrogenase assembly protein OpcA
VRRLVRASLLDGHEHTAQVAKASLGVLVRADSGHETYVALRILGSVPKNLLIVILDLVPGCDRNAWFPELAMPHPPSGDRGASLVEPDGPGGGGTAHRRR